MKGQKASHLWLPILFFALALTINVSYSGEKSEATSLTRQTINASDQEAIADDNVARKRNKSSHNNVVMNNKRNYNGGGGGGGNDGGGGIGGGGGWGWGGGGGRWWGWGCRRHGKYNGRPRSDKKGNYDHNKNGNVHKNERCEYIMGEYAQCMGRGRCRWRRLDCPLHCGGACFYDCKQMCKANCRR